MKKYVYAVTYRNEKNCHTFLIYTIRTDDNSYNYFGDNSVKFFACKCDAEKYCQNEVKNEWDAGMEQSGYQFV